VGDAASARELVAPDGVPLLCENCDCTGMFVMETISSSSGSSQCIIVRFTISIICGGWFIPKSPQQSSLRITAGDVFLVSAKNLPFK